MEQGLLQFTQTFPAHFMYFNEARKCLAPYPAIQNSTRDVEGQGPPEQYHTAKTNVH